MSRHRMNSLSSLVDGQEAGGYVLPADVLAAHDAYMLVKALTVEPPAALDADTAAARIVNAATAGQTVDTLAAGRELHRADEDRQAADKARHVFMLAVEQAADAQPTWQPTAPRQSSLPTYGQRWTTYTPRHGRQPRPCTATPSSPRS